MAETEREPESSEGESEDDQISEFESRFVIRGVTRMVEYATVSVLIHYLTDNDDRREYEYFIPYDEYVYDKHEIARHVYRQNKKRKQQGSGSSDRKK
jgi:hypothetical protein